MSFDGPVKSSRVSNKTETDIMSVLQKFRLKRTDFVPLAVSLLILLQVVVCLILFQLYAKTKTSIPISRSTNQTTSPVQQPKILCWILTFDSAQNRQKVDAVRRTWARRCDKYLIVSNGSQLEESPGEQTLRLPIEHEGRDQLWRKVVMTNTYLYEHYLNQFDWFMKADDDTYVLVDSLRQFLANKTAGEADNTVGNKTGHQPGMIYYGHRFKPYVRQGYMSGGSGYVVSREALRRLVEDGFRPQLSGCGVFDTAFEDLEIGKCLEAVGVEAGDTRDVHGKETFLPLSPEFLLTTDDQQQQQQTDFWYFKYNYYKSPLETDAGDSNNNNTSGLGANCCSNQPISFHYIEPNLMYLIDWLLYDVNNNNKRNE